MAMNSSVADGRIDQTTSRVWLPWVKVTGFWLVAASYFHRNQTNARFVAMKITPVSARMNRKRLSMTAPWALMFSGSQCPAIGHQPAIAQTKMPTPKIGTMKNSRLQNLPTYVSPQQGFANSKVNSQIP